MHPRTVKKVVICKGNYHKHLYEEIPIQALPVSVWCAAYV